MATEIQLHHIGEVVLAGLLRELANRGDLNIECLIHKNCSLAAALTNAAVKPPFAFDTNVQLASIVVDGETFSFDGAHGVDVLCRGAGSTGLAMEAKLGIDRMARGEFTKRFLAPVSHTTHTPRRIKGSMVAILNYRAFESGGSLPLITAGPHPVDLASDWFLVVRSAVWRRWNRLDSAAPPIAPDAHILSFEDIAHQYGDANSFDSLVQRLVGNDFSRSWVI